MSTTFEFLSMAGIRAADLRQLVGYIEHMEEDGTYWGNRKEFQQRHDRIKRWITDAERYAYSEGVKMPKERRHHP